MRKKSPKNPKIARTTATTAYSARLQANPGFRAVRVPAGQRGTDLRDIARPLPSNAGRPRWRALPLVRLLGGAGELGLRVAAPNALGGRCGELAALLRRGMRMLLLLLSSLTSATIAALLLSSPATAGFACAPGALLKGGDLLVANMTLKDAQVRPRIRPRLG